VRSGEERADANRGRYGIDPLLFRGGHEPAEDRMRVRILFRHCGRADEFHQRSHRLPLPARAEIVLEGFLYPTRLLRKARSASSPALRPAPGATPYMRVERAYRENPTLVAR
jgi:hypothetical protein